MAKSSITVGGGYVEDENFVPESTDQQGTFNTSGLGAHERIEEVSSVFEVDRVKTAEQILAATDPDNTTVSSDRVLLPETNVDNETALDQITAAAEARVKQGVVINGPTPAEREADFEAPEGETPDLRPEASAGAGPANAAQSDLSTKTTGSEAKSDSGDDGSDDDEDKAPAKSASKGEWVDYAVSQGADREEAEGDTKEGLQEKYGS